VRGFWWSDENYAGDSFEFARYFNVLTPDHTAGRIRELSSLEFCTYKFFHFLQVSDFEAIGLHRESWP